MNPPDTKGTAPLDVEARKFCRARQGAEATKAGVRTNPDDESSPSPQPVSAGGATPGAGYQVDHLSDP